MFLINIIMNLSALIFKPLIPLTKLFYQKNFYIKKILSFIIHASDGKTALDLRFRIPIVHWDNPLQCFLHIRVSSKPVFDRCLMIHRFHLQFPHCIKSAHAPLVLLQQHLCRSFGQIHTESTRLY